LKNLTGERATALPGGMPFVGLVVACRARSGVGEWSHRPRPKSRLSGPEGQTSGYCVFQPEYGHEHLRMAMMQSDAAPDPGKRPILGEQTTSNFCHALGSLGRSSRSRLANHQASLRHTRMLAGPGSWKNGEGSEITQSTPCSV